jgi:hypothetical protein
MIVLFQVVPRFTAIFFFFAFVGNGEEREDETEDRRYLRGDRVQGKPSGQDGLE